MYLLNQKRKQQEVPINTKKPPLLAVDKKLRDFCDTLTIVMFVIVMFKPYLHYNIILISSNLQ